MLLFECVVCIPAVVLSAVYLESTLVLIMGFCFFLLFKLLLSSIFVVDYLVDDEPGA